MNEIMLKNSISKSKIKDNDSPNKQQVARLKIPLPFREDRKKRYENSSNNSSFSSHKNETTPLKKITNKRARLYS